MVAHATTTAQAVEATQARHVETNPEVSCDPLIIVWRVNRATAAQCLAFQS